MLLSDQIGLYERRAAAEGAEEAAASGALSAAHGGAEAACTAEGEARHGAGEAACAAEAAAKRKQRAATQVRLEARGLRASGVARHQQTSHLHHCLANGT